MTDDTT